MSDDSVIQLRPTPMHFTPEEFNNMADRGMLPTNPEVAFHIPIPDKLRVGDLVNWRHGWGSEPPRLARVKLIEIECVGAENGLVVAECTWEVARKGSTVVDLDNGHWAYGDQLSPQ